MALVSSRLRISSRFAAELDACKSLKAERECSERTALAQFYDAGRDMLQFLTKQASDPPWRMRKTQELLAKTGMRGKLVQ